MRWLGAGVIVDTPQMGRLALRQEGDNWVAYYALPDTMATAIFLGSIRMNAVRSNPKYKDQFMMLMRDVLSDLIEEKTGFRPEWSEPASAPEHERAGSA